MTKKYIPAELRRLVVERARNCCEYCRYPGRYAPQTPPIDHITPREAGGQTTTENLAQSCQGCNGHKATRTSATDPVTGLAVPLYNPREQRWDEHLSWSEDYLRITGLTPTGRATVEALQLNREGLVNMRHVLYAIGEHPLTTGYGDYTKERGQIYADMSVDDIVAEIEKDRGQS